MKSTYKLTYRLVASILLFSLFLQSCGNSYNQLAPQEKELTRRTSELSDNPLIEINKPFVTSGGYLASFYEEDGELKADLKVDEKQPEPNYKGVPVLVEEGTNLADLTKLDSTTQQNRIQLSGKNGKINRVILFNSGVAGGMNDESDDKGASDESEKQADEAHNQQENEINEKISKAQKQKNFLLLKEALYLTLKYKYEATSKKIILQICPKKQVGHLVTITIGYIIYKGEVETLHTLESILDSNIFNDAFKKRIEWFVGPQKATITPKFVEDFDLALREYVDYLTRVLLKDEDLASSSFDFLEGVLKEIKIKLSRETLTKIKEKLDQFRRAKQAYRESDSKKGLDRLLEIEMATNLLDEELARSMQQEEFETKVASDQKRRKRRRKEKGDKSSTPSLEELPPLIEDGEEASEKKVQNQQANGEGKNSKPEIVSQVEHKKENLPFTDEEETRAKVYNQQKKGEKQKEELNKLQEGYSNWSNGDQEDAFSIIIKKHRREITKKKKKAYTEDAQDKQKLTEDLEKLMKIRTLIEDLIKSIVSTKVLPSILIENLKQIGQLLHEISWREDNPKCIRNKHGYRNRHKDKGNNKNERGAKLDFETLAHLKDLDATQCSNLLTANVDLVKTSLEIIQQKINFILYDKYDDLNEEDQLTLDPKYNAEKDSHDEDEGFLKKVSAYYHDVKCINKLLKLIKRMSPAYQSLNDKVGFLRAAIPYCYHTDILNRLLPLLDESSNQIYPTLNLANKLDRYWLGRFFVLFGETAKGISDYIKYEKEGKPEAKDSIIRFLFTKLGHHRQKIKGIPSITYLTKGSTLQAIKENFEKAKPELEKFLYIIKHALNGYSEKINDYDTISTLLENNTDLINYLTTALNLTPLIKNSLKHNKSSELKKLLKELNDIKEEITQLQEAKDKFEADRQKFEAQKQEKNENQPSVGAKPLVAIHENKQVLKLKNILERYLEAPSIDPITNVGGFMATPQQGIGNALRGELTKQSKLLEQELQENINSLSLLNLLTKLKAKLEQSSKNSLSDHISELGAEHRSMESKLSRTETKIQNLTIKIKNKEEEKVKKEQEIKKRLQARTRKPQSKQVKIIKKITREIQNLQEIEQKKNDPKADYARTLSLAFIGEYLKELSKDQDFQEYLKDDILFWESINIAIHTRHKTMHEVLDNPENLINQTIKSHLLPWQQNYESLKIIMLNDQNCQDLILELLPKLPAWNKSEYSKEKEMVVKISLVDSYNRLMKYDEVEKIFLDITVQNFLNDPIQSPLLKLYLYRGFIRSLHERYDSEKTRAAIEEFWRYLAKVKIEAPELYSYIKSTGIPQNIFGVYYLVNKDLTPSLSLYSLTDLEVTDPNDLLNLADNLLENYECKKAIAIIQPILIEFESNQNTFTDLHVPRFVIVHKCYRMMSMYYRCLGDFEQALLYLDKADEVLKEYSNEAKAYWGGKIDRENSDGHFLKSCCYRNWGIQFMDIVYDTDKEFALIKAAGIDKFQKSYEEGCKSLRSAVKEETSLSLVGTYISLAHSKAYLGLLQDNKGDIEYSKILLNKAVASIEKLTNSNNSMPVCEFWISLAEIYKLHKDETKEIYCLAKAESNNYWKFCAKSCGLPLQHNTFLIDGKVGFFRRLTWNQLYDYGEKVIIKSPIFKGS